MPIAFLHKMCYSKHSKNGKAGENGMYHIKIQNFEGPFDLLFHLLEKNQMDIYDIQIREITDQYMDYLYSMQELDLEVSSSFLVMAATLLHIKSRMLLPVKKEEVEEEDPRLDLVLKLVEYKKFKELSLEFAKREQEWSSLLYKYQEPISFQYDDEILELNPQFLCKAMHNVNERNRYKMADTSKKMQKILAHEKVSLSSKIREVLSTLRKKTRFWFSEVFSLKKQSKLEVVTGFQAILELSKGKKVTLAQDKPFGEINVQRLEDVA